MKPATDIKLHIPLVRKGQVLQTMGCTWGQEGQKKLCAQGKQYSPVVVAVIHLLSKQSECSIRKAANNTQCRNTDFVFRVKCFI